MKNASACRKRVYDAVFDILENTGDATTAPFSAMRAADVACRPMTVEKYLRPHLSGRSRKRKSKSKR